MLDRPGGYDPSPPADESLSGALRLALRRARVEAAERTDIVIDLRQAELARLQILKEELEPVFAQVPREVDLFDLGLSPGERPRLFIDMVSFVEMGRDKRLYRFMRDGRHGRTVAAESAETDPIVEAVTAYVARRLVERERLLTDDDRIAGVADAPPPAGLATVVNTGSSNSAAMMPAGQAVAAAPAASAPPRPRERKRRGWMRALTILLAFAVGGALGAVVVVGLIVAAARGYIPL